MRIRYANSKITKTCVICGNHTGSSKIYEEGGISIRVPVCGREENDCQNKVIIKPLTKSMLRELKSEISNSNKELEEITS